MANTLTNGERNRTMSKASDYIRNYTKRCSNAVEGCNQDAYYSEGLYQPWLTQENALAAVEIAREEMLNDICEWIEENIGEYCDGENTMFSAIHIENIDVFGQEKFINDLKQAMKDET